MFCSEHPMDASLRASVRRPGSMDATVLPSLVAGKRVFPRVVLTQQEEEGLSDEAKKELERREG